MGAKSIKKAYCKGAMDVWDWCYLLNRVESTYFPEVRFIVDQFDYYYHERDDGFSYYNDSLRPHPSRASEA